MNKQMIGWSLLLFLAASGAIYAQNLITLDEAIKIGAEEIDTRLAEGVKVVVLNFNSPSQRFSNYVLDEMMTELVRSGKVTVVDRVNLELIQQEMHFQMSGEVSDTSAQAIGQKLGAQSIISGSVEDMGNFYRIRFRTIEVETAAIQVLSSINIQKDTQTATLIGGSSGRNTSTTRSPRTSSESTDDSWKHHRFYLGARLGGGPNFYEPSSEMYGNMNIEGSFGFNGTVQFAVQLADIFAIQTELMITHDEGTVRESGYGENGSWEYEQTDSFNSLIIPILAKFTFRPHNFSINGFGGIYFTVPLGKMTLAYSWWEQYYGSESGSERYDIETSAGFMIGGSFGIKAGPGVIFMDIRFAGDFRETRLTENGWTADLFTRRKLPITIGYEIGFGHR